MLTKVVVSVKLSSNIGPTSLEVQSQEKNWISYISTRGVLGKKILETMKETWKMFMWVELDQHYDIVNVVGPAPWQEW